MRAIFWISLSGIALAGCSNAGMPLYETPEGLWRTEMQLLTPVSQIIPAAERAAMDPSEFATLQARMSRPQVIHAGKCREASSVLFTELLASSRLAPVPRAGCTMTSHEATSTGYRSALTCRGDEGDVAITLDGEVSPGRVQTDMQWQAAPRPSQPPPPQMRLRIIETRLGDCPE